MIPAHPLALNAARKLDERRQRALTRYYLASGVDGLAVGVHTTQFEIREHSLLRPVLELAAEEARGKNVALVAGLVGDTPQAVREAELAVSLGYDIGLLSLARLRDASVSQLIEHARCVGQVMPLCGFYLQPAVGGRVLPYEFWREFAALEAVRAIKVAPFNRYQTLDVLRAVQASGRRPEIQMLTGNDDNIVLDLLSGDFDGGLLGHWSVWTGPAVSYTREALAAAHDPTLPRRWLPAARGVTDANAAFFDAANAFHGCIAGLHEVLQRQGLLEGRWCLNPREDLSPGQMEEIDRVYREYPRLSDDSFVREHLDEWLR